MIPRRAIDVRVPADLAELLRMEGLARPAIERRSSILSIVAEGTSIASVTITLLQAPATIRQVAAALVRWAGRHHDETNSSGKLIIRSSRGEITLDVDGSTDLATVAAILQDVMFPQQDMAFPHTELGWPNDDGIEGLTL